MLLIISLVTGLLFGLGLAVSEMTNPAVVLGFLDISGDWNPSLLFVMAAAVSVGMLGYAFQRRRGAPLFAKKWSVPTRRDLDKNLVLGAALFGIGWGLSGYCPGPGLTALINNPMEALYFVGALVIGSAAFQFQNHRKKG